MKVLLLDLYSHYQFNISFPIHRLINITCEKESEFRLKKGDIVEVPYAGVIKVYDFEIYAHYLQIYTINSENKYFLKFLPTKSNIEIGDYVQLEEGIYGQLIKKISKQLYQVKGLNGWGKDKSGAKTIGEINANKVKLFLCTSEIEIGDNVFDTTGERHLYKEEIKDHSFYKIMGEFSDDFSANIVEKVYKMSKEDFVFDCDDDGNKYFYFKI